MQIAGNDFQFKRATLSLRKRVEELINNELNPLLEKHAPTDEFAVVDGAEFLFKAARPSLKKEVGKFGITVMAKKAGLIDTESVGSPGWEDVRSTWKKFCELMFVAWDDRLDLNNITEDEMLDIPRVFSWAGYPKENQTGFDEIEAVWIELRNMIIVGSADGLSLKNLGGRGVTEIINSFFPNTQTNSLKSNS